MKNEKLKRLEIVKHGVRGMEVRGMKTERDCPQWLVVRALAGPWRVGKLGTG